MPGNIFLHKYRLQTPRAKPQPQSAVRTLSTLGSPTSTLPQGRGSLRATLLTGARDWRALNQNHFCRNIAQKYKREEDSGRQRHGHGTGTRSTSWRTSVFGVTGLSGSLPEARPPAAPRRPEGHISPRLHHRSVAPASPDFFTGTAIAGLCSPGFIATMKPTLPTSSVMAAPSDGASAS